MEHLKKRGADYGTGNFGALGLRTVTGRQPTAQPLQDLIDRLLCALAGLTPAEITGLEERLVRML